MLSVIYPSCDVKIYKVLQCSVKYSRIIIISESFGKGVVINFQLCNLQKKHVSVRFACQTHINRITMRKCLLNDF